MRAALLLLSVFWVSIAALSQTGTNSGAPSGKQASPQLLSIRSLLHGEQHDDNLSILLRGTVTYTGDPAIIQDQTGAIAVHASSPEHVTLGDEVEVRGVDAISNGTHVIQHAQIQSLWPSSLPAPLSLTPDLAAEGEYDLYLVEIEGTIVKNELADNNIRQLSLEGGHQFFSASFPSDSTESTLEPGSVVRLTGVLFVHKTHFGLQSGSFTLLLRSAQDIRLIHPPSWWTPRHIGLLALLLIPLGLLIHLIRLENIKRRFDAITGERARIARDIHDTLAQGFAGIAFQLEGASREMDRDHSNAREHLDLALSMVRHSRKEAHRAITTLRSSSREMPLEAMIEEIISQMALGSHIKIQIHVLGNTYQLPAIIADQMFRLTQEAVSNALQHAHASNIWITLNYQSNEMTLEISDDGQGFDISNVAGPQEGHFGLSGMTERADGLNATLDITSSSTGTKLTLRVPHETPRSRKLRPTFQRWRSQL